VTDGKNTKKKQIYITTIYVAKLNANISYTKTQQLCGSQLLLPSFTTTSLFVMTKKQTNSTSLI